MMMRVTKVGALQVVLLLSCAFLSSCAISKSQRDIQTAENYLQQGKLDEAISVYNKVIQQHPESEFAGQANFQLAKITYQIGDCNQSIHYLDRFFNRYFIAQNNIKALYMLGDCRYRSSDLIGALSALEKLSRLTPRDGYQLELQNEGLGLLAKIYREINDYQSAAKVYEQLVAKAETADELLNSLLNLGDCQLRLGLTEKAAKSYQQALDLPPKTKNYSQAILKLAKLQASSSMFTEIPDTLIMMDDEDLKQHEEVILGLIDIYIHNSGSPQNLKLSQKLDGTLLGYYFTRKLIDYLDSKQEYALELELLARLESIYGKLDIYDQDWVEERIKLARLNQRVKKNRIGVLLPLTGAAAGFGEKALQGIELAVAEYNARAKDFPIEIVVEDSGGDAEQSIAAARSLIIDDGAIGIIGPLLNRYVIAIQGVLGEYQTAAISPGVPPIEDINLTYLFYNGITMQDQAYSMVDFAVDILGIYNLAVLYPENPIGKLLTEHFLDRLSQRGGQLAIALPYEPTATDFKGLIEQLKQADFDGLFIPDYAQKAAQIIPQLLYYEIEDVALLGWNGWNSTELIEIGDDYVDSVVFADGFFLHSDNPYTHSFVLKYRQRYKSNPDIITAQAYDAAMMMIHCIRDGNSSRENLYRCLRETKNFIGASGFIDRLEGNLARKELFLIGVNQGRFIQLN